MDEEKIEGHERKPERYDEPEDHAEQFDDRLVFFVEEAEGLKAGLEPVLQMVAKQN